MGWLKFYIHWGSLNFVQYTLVNTLINFVDDIDGDIEVDQSLKRRLGKISEKKMRVRESNKKFKQKRRWLVDKHWKKPEVHIWSQCTQKNKQKKMTLETHNVITEDRKWLKFFVKPRLNYTKRHHLTCKRRLTKISEN